MKHQPCLYSGISTTKTVLNCYEENVNMNIEADYISEITAMFATANARMRLYKMQSWLHPSQILYCDSDSVIHVYDETNPEHKYWTNDQPNLPNG